ncbi:MAG: peptide-N-glycosidase F-related protein [Phycisphaerales bacterium JB052]
MRYPLSTVILILCFFSLPSVGGELVARTAPTDSVVESVWVSFRARFPVPDDAGYSGENRGLGLVLIDPDRGSLSEDFAWDEPNTDHSIAFGFDVHNQIPDKSEDENGRVMGWFDADGNWYERPQREVSVHANGRERINVRSDYEFRTDEWVDVDVQVRYMLGGAQVLVRLDGQTIIDQPIWDVRPMHLHAMVGVEGDDIEVRDLAISRVTELDAPLPEPVRLTAFDAQLLQNAARLKSDVDFSSVPESVGRVIATMTLSEPEMGYDHWDKKGTVGIRIPTGEVDEEGNALTERFEVFRFITPYRRGWTWHMDVTDLLPLFEDTRQLDMHIGTYMKGWLVTFTLDFYEGTPEREPIAVMNLWNGEAEIGNPDKPTEGFYVPRDIAVPEGATSARVRATVTGHGMYPNSNNAGEFMPIWRTLTISSGNSEGGGDVLEGDFISMSARNHLWKTDCYLNPCRPQGGTWKFDRSGWAPGDKVEPWIVDTQREFMMGDTLRIEYTLDPYLNEGRDETWAPHHWTDAVVVFYK